MSEEKILAKDREEEKLVQERLVNKIRKKRLITNILPFLGVVFIFLFFIIVTNGKTITSTNLINLVNQSYTLIIVAVGAAFVYAYGGMDMSVGAVQALISVIIAVFALNHWLPTWCVLPLAILLGMVISSLNGIVSIYTKVPVFVVSLCIMNICTGIVATVVSKKDIYMPYSEYKLWNNNILKGIVMIFVIALGYYVFEYTKMGKNLKIMGGNMTSAKLNGINLTKYTVLAYVLIGVTIGLVAFFAMARTGVVTASTGNGLMLDVLTAIVLGGFPLTGGAKAKIRAAVLGAIIVAILNNGLTIWGVDPNYVDGVQGILFLIIVYISYERRKGEIFD